jgi:small nuclear ribonucleoprotein (snRNP)-like protein
VLLPIYTSSYIEERNKNPPLTASRLFKENYQMSIGTHPNNNNIEIEESPAVAQVRSMLNKKLRVKVTDGRVFFGYLNCFDKRGNIILINATECRAANGYVQTSNGFFATAHILSFWFFPRLQTHPAPREIGVIHSSISPRLTHQGTPSPLSLSLSLHRHTEAGAGAGTGTGTGRLRRRGQRRLGLD